ncbi:sugar kinase [Gandjariella thermophila]|uniref:Sugar kinase n=1 Tax=Gandjariella thermophila TaxID=1931992 RepID=A0A4D4J8K2_9PSEU|nr:sugar kinase [Gandjariella thermophila]GDY30988.1 sugar kinase [Gandjariella thermophila]
MGIEEPGAPEVLCVGETMAVLMPGEPGPAHRVRAWTRTVGGAESNVACHLAGLGVRSAWLSAVGDDAFGRAVVDAVRAAGVDVRGVRVDPLRPTGLYVKESAVSGSRVRYYRRGSAAAALGPEVLDGVDLAGVRLVHVTGITAALSDSCLRLLRALLGPRRHLVSFDVNWRPALWADEHAADRGLDPAEVLRDLADAADVVLVGADEAERVWGTADPDALRALLPHPRTVVVKRDAEGATLIEGGATVFEPSLRVDVVEPIGAGDAFAAGFLAATLAGHDARRRLRAGHLRAAATLLTRHDVGEPLPEATVTRLLSCDERTWAAARITLDGALR